MTKGELQAATRPTHTEAYAGDDPKVCRCCHERRPSTKRRGSRIVNSDDPRLCNACWDSPVVKIADCLHGYPS